MLASYQLRMALALAMIMLSIEVQSATFPSDKQCHALREQQVAIKPEIEGWCLLIDRSKGNCLACHSVDINTWPTGLSTPGNIGPELRGFPDQISDEAGLRRVIYDASLQNSRTIMPLFGKHRILTNEEIGLITKFLISIQ